MFNVRKNRDLCLLDDKFHIQTADLYEKIEILLNLCVL